MSTIAYRDGVMAADRLAWLGKGGPTHSRKRKIHRLDDGSLVGISTSVVGAAEQLLEWMRQGANPDSGLFQANVPSEFSIIQVRRDGTLRFWDDGFWPQTPEADAMVCGSGSDWALGAMLAGATAEQAVRIAAKCDPYTTSEVDVLYLEGDLMAGKHG